MSDYNLTLVYRELIAKIKGHCQAGVTGTVFIKTDSDHLARFIIRNGEVVSCVYRHKTGFDAISMIRGIASGTFRFSEHSVEGMKFPAMPDTREFFDLLEQPVVEEAVPENNLTESKPVRSAVSNSNDPGLIAIKDVLQNYIGPMADLVCNHYLASKSDLLQAERHEELIDMLAENIGNEAERREFRTRALQRIGRA